MGPCGPGGGPYGRTEYGRAISRANGIPGKGKGLRLTKGPEVLVKLRLNAPP